MDDEVCYKLYKMIVLYNLSAKFFNIPLMNINTKKKFILDCIINYKRTGKIDKNAAELYCNIVYGNNNDFNSFVKLCKKNIIVLDNDKIKIFNKFYDSNNIIKFIEKYELKNSIIR